jgi:hypothetical protein
MSRHKRYLVAEHPRQWLKPLFLENWREWVNIRRTKNIGLEDTQWPYNMPFNGSKGHRRHSNTAAVQVSTDSGKVKKVLGYQSQAVIK